MTKAEIEALAVTAWLARHGLEEAPASAYGNGERWVSVPVPASSQNGRKRVQVHVRRAS